MGCTNIASDPLSMDKGHEVSRVRKCGQKDTPYNHTRNPKPASFPKSSQFFRALLGPWVQATLCLSLIHAAPREMSLSEKAPRISPYPLKVLSCIRQNRASEGTCQHPLSRVEGLFSVSQANCLMGSVAGSVSCIGVSDIIQRLRTIDMRF